MELPAIPGRGELRLRLEVPVKRLGRPTKVTFLFNDRVLGTLEATRERNDVRFVVESRAGAPNVLRIVVDDSFRAPGDPRELALSLLEYGWHRL